jgi:sulfate permease, SulP family
MEALRNNKYLKQTWLFIEHTLPIARWLPKYRRKDLGGDVIASLALAALAAPEAISYASIAGVKPANGLYCAFIAPIVYGFFGASPQLVTGPTTVMSLLTRSAVPPTWAGVTLVPETALYISICALLALVAGLIQVTLAIFRAGFLARLISAPVIVGFCVGSSLVIASTQFATLVGAPKCVGSTGGSCTVIEAIQNVVNAGKTNKLGWGVPVAALCCLIFLFAFKFGLPRVLPAKIKVLANAGPLALMIIMCSLMASPNIGAAMKKVGITTAETIPAGLPSPSAPFPSDELTGGALPSSDDITTLLTRAAPLAIIGFVESLTIAKTTSRLFGPYPVDVSCELLAVGASNIGSALLQGYPGEFYR